MRSVGGLRRRLGKVAASWQGLALVCVGGVLLTAWVTPAAAVPVAVVLAALILVGARSRTGTERVVSQVRQARSAASRHEWLIETAIERNRVLADQSYALARSVSRRGAPAAEVPAGPRPAVPFLFVTSNGFGLGHITRCLAIARRLEPGSAQVLTLSVGYQAVREESVRVRYFPSKDTSGLAPRVWNDLFQDHLEEVMESLGTRVLVFDGPVVYPALMRAARARAVSLVWLRRDLWQEGTDRSQYDHPSDVCDYLLVPGEAASHVTVPSFPRAALVPPVTIRSDAPLSREEALGVLGLPASGRYYLLQLGSTAVAGVEDLTSEVVAALRRHLPDHKPVILLSAVSRQDEVPGVRTIRGLYPAADALAAFDLAVVAGGYNTVHELLAARVPALVIPNPASQTDDQALRATLLAEQGLALAATDVAGLRGSLERLADPAVRQRLAARAASLPCGFDGATEAAGYLTEVLRLHERAVAACAPPLPLAPSSPPLC